MELQFAAGDIDGFEATENIQSEQGTAVVEEFTLAEDHLGIAVTLTVEGTLNKLSGAPSIPTVVTGSMRYNGPIPWRLAGFGNRSMRRPD